MAAAAAGKEEMEEAELVATLGDFTLKENWDRFFTIRPSDRPFEWYADWPSLRSALLPHLPSPPSTTTNILVPGCGNSRLSQFLYDAGFTSITNIDFSKVIVADMLRLHLRPRPLMKWRVMDMTHLQFPDESFDVVLDKGGLDALMEPQHGSKFGSLYLSEVKRVLKFGGQYICFTLTESHVLELLFSKFRFGWKTVLYVLQNKPSKNPKFQTFMIIIERENSSFLCPIGLSFDLPTLDCSSDQGHGLLRALETENKQRNDIFLGDDVVYSYEDLQLGVKGDLKQLLPGRRAQLTLGDQWDAQYSYQAVLLDAKDLSESFLYQFGVFLVPASRAHEWLFSSEEGQWIIVESSHAARLVMVLLDVRHTIINMEDIQKDLSPLVRKLAPENGHSGAQIPFLMANDGVWKRKIIQQISSATTGQITVEDVIYSDSDDVPRNSKAPKNSVFRRLTFGRSMGVVQSEALLKDNGPCQKDLKEKVKKKPGSSSRSIRKYSKNNCSSELATDVLGKNMRIDHSYLASSYHSGIISGLALIAAKFQSATSATRQLKMVIVGLGAGLLPMFLRHSIPILDIEVVELDPMMLNIGRDYFEFKEDEQLKVHIADGIKFLMDVETVVTSSQILSEFKDGEDPESLASPQVHIADGIKFLMDVETVVTSSQILSEFKDGEDPESLASPQEIMTTKSKEFKTHGVDVIIIDADASDLSTGLTCPPAAFTNELFLFSVKKCLSDGGLFVINLVSRSETVRMDVITRLKSVFGRLFYLEIEGDLNRVLFALSEEESKIGDDISIAAIQIQKLMILSDADKLNVTETARKIKCL